MILVRSNNSNSFCLEKQLQDVTTTIKDNQSLKDSITDRLLEERQSFRNLKEVMKGIRFKTQRVRGQINRSDVLKHTTI